MSCMKSLLGIYALAALNAFENETQGHGYNKINNPKETEGERKLRLDKAEIEINKHNGLKEHFYNGNSVFALNQKNADKKAKKRGWI